MGDFNQKLIEHKVWERIEALDKGVGYENCDWTKPIRIETIEKKIGDFEERIGQNEKDIKDFGEKFGEKIDRIENIINNMQSLKEKNDTLEWEKGNLRSKIGKMENIEKEHIKRIEELGRDKQKLTEEKDKLEKERDKLVGQKNELTEEKDKLEKERDKLVGQKNELVEEKDKLEKERDKLAGQKNELTEEKDKLEKERDKLAGQKNELTEEKDKLEKERDKLVGQKNELTEEKDKLEKERDKLVGQKNELAEEKDKLEKERDKLVGQKNELTEEKDKLEKERDKLVGQKNELTEQKNKMEKEKEAYESSWNQYISRYKELMLLMYKCNSLQRLIKTFRMDVSKNAEDFQSVISFVGMLGNQTTFTDLLYEIYMRSADNGGAPLDDDDYRFIDGLNTYYKKIYGLDYDVLYYPDKESIKFEKDKMKDLNSPNNVYREFSAVYAPAVMRGNTNIEKKMIVKGE